MGCIPRYLLEMTVFHSKGSITLPVSWQSDNILIIACCVGFVLMVLLFLAFLLRGKVG